MSEEGKTQPQAELRATLAAFFAPPVAPSPLGLADPDRSPADQHPQCRFPARYAWLSRVLAFDPARLPVQPCPEYDEWRQRLDLRSVTLVFADAYINNPASMFGHTFLRFERGDGSDLLANSANFSATPWTTNPLIYPIAGIVGWFPGTWSTLPYYLKVREYSALENRDLWEYPLSLSEQELQALSAHLWELGPIPFRYHYLDENCSYQLLTLLEGMDPGLRLSDRYTAWVFPTATLRTLVRHSPYLRDQAPRRRPSRYAEMVARRDALDRDEQRLAHQLARQADPADLASVQALQPPRRVAVLDAAYELHRYRAKDAPQGEDAARDQRLLQARGRVDLPSPPLQLPTPPLPHQGHAPGMAALGAGLDGPQSFFRLRLRPALHDLLAPQGSFVSGTRLEMVHLALRLDQPPSTDPRTTPIPRLEQLILFDAASLAPTERWLPRMAWRVRTGWEQERAALARGDCQGRGCLYYGLAGGPGLAFSLRPVLPGLLYGFLEGEAALGSGVGRHLRLAPGAALGLLLGPPQGLRLHGELRARYPAWSAKGFLPGPEATVVQGEAGLAAHLGPAFELRGLGRWVSGRTEGAVEGWVYW